MIKIFMIIMHPKALNVSPRNSSLAIVLLCLMVQQMVSKEVRKNVLILVVCDVVCSLAEAKEVSLV